MSSRAITLPKAALALAVAGLVIAGSLWFGVFKDNEASETGVVASPAAYTTEFWDRVLGGDQGLNEASFKELGDLSNSDLPNEDAKVLAELGASITKATYGGVGRTAFGEYFADTAGSSVCSNVSVVAASPMVLPVSPNPDNLKYSKILVAWRGECSPAQPEQSEGQPSIAYVYAAKAAQWAPLHEWQVPGSSIVGGTDASGQVVPAEYELAQFKACANPEGKDIKARIAVVDSFELMCESAKNEGVALVVERGFRTPSEQAELFERAVKYYGTEKAARQWVAFSDGNVCASKHCAGVAVSLVENEKSLNWLARVVGCSTVSGFKEASACGAGEGVFTEVQRWGFVQPASAIPQYLEYVLPLDDGSHSSACQPDSTKTVPQMVASIFRCRLSAAGVDAETSKTVVAEALVVANCSSGFVAESKALAGRWADSPYPITGERYTQAGVFMLSDGVAQRWVPGGAAAVLSPVANINGAASLWLAGRSWGPWPCATGQSTPYTSGPVLPQFGGPALPEWAFTY